MGSGQPQSPVIPPQTKPPSSQPPSSVLDGVQAPLSPVSLNDLYTLLCKVLAELQNEYDAGQITVNVDVLSIGTTPAVLYTGQKRVRGGIFENLSATDTITFAAGQSGKPVKLTAGQGIVLNPAASAGQGGGTWAFYNIDLSTLTAVTNTNNAQNLSVVYYV